MRGKLALAGIDLRVSAACWFDAAWAIVVDAPHEALSKVNDQMVLAQNRARPNRETWGVSEEEQALMAKAMNQPAVPRRTRGDGAPY